MSDAPIVCLPTSEENLAILAEASDPQAALQRARKDTAVVPSVYYVDLVNRVPQEAQSELNAYRSQILDYRSWASLRLWATVDKSQELPQDDSLEATANRAGHVARAAKVDISHLPWLFLSENITKHKHISSPVSDLHPTLIKSVLEGFVEPDDVVVEGLEGVVEQIAERIQQKPHIPDNLSQLIVLEKFEWIPENRSVKSYTRTILFDITDDTVFINAAKRSQEHIEFNISYTECNFSFMERHWREASKHLPIDDNFRGYVKENTFLI